MPRVLHMVTSVHEAEEGQQVFLLYLQKMYLALQNKLNAAATYKGLQAAIFYIFVCV